MADVSQIVPYRHNTLATTITVHALAVRMVATLATIQPPAEVV